MRPVDLVIADAGPLISLAHADCLDLVKIFGRPVAIMDVAKAECLAKPDSPDHPALKHWFERNHNTVHIIDTPVMPLYELARDRGGIPATTKDLGDFALVYALNHINEIAKPNTVPLVLTEDKELRATTVARGDVHVLSTRSWLKGLEIAGLIRNATDVLDRMGRHGRRVAKVQADHPAMTKDGRTDWIDHILSSAMTNDQLLARFAASDEKTKAVLNGVLITSADNGPRQDAIALGALASQDAQDLVLAAIRVGHRLDHDPDKADQEVRNVFSAAKKLTIGQSDLTLLVANGASNGFLRKVQELVVQRDEPGLS